MRTPNMLKELGALFNEVYSISFMKVIILNRTLFGCKIHSYNLESKKNHD